jgi:copper chaperone CopZ
MTIQSGVTLDIGGMRCGHCVAAVRKALQDIPGIESAQVIVGSATIAVVDGERDKVIDAAAAAIERAGYVAAAR